MDSAKGSSCNTAVLHPGSYHRKRHGLLISIFGLERRVLDVTGLSSSGNQFFSHRNHQPNLSFDAPRRDCCSGFKLDVPHEVYSSSATENFRAEKNSRDAQKTGYRSQESAVQTD